MARKRAAEGLRIEVNGSLGEIHSDPNPPLLWVLRDEHGLPGTKFGCGKGPCSIPVKAALAQLRGS